MTYNFDPDHWYEIELKALQRELKENRITPEQMETKMALLEKRHAEMWERLDGAYQVR